jgi:hypothetical protein
MEQDVRKTINLLGIIVVSTIICLTQASCSIFDDYLNPRLRVVNKYNLPITRVSMKIVSDNIVYDENFIRDPIIAKGKSETFSLESYPTPYSAEVIVYFGDMYSYKELSFNSGRTTTATLNVNGILE